MTQLVSTLRISSHRSFFVMLIGFVLTIWLGFTSTAFGAQEPRAKNLDSAPSRTTLTAQESKTKDLNVALTSTAFTYQGQLKDVNGPVTGAFDFQFMLYSAQADGEQLGANEMK